MRRFNFGETESKAKVGRMDMSALSRFAKETSGDGWILLP